MRQVAFLLFSNSVLLCISNQSVQCIVRAYPIIDYFTRISELIMDPIMKSCALEPLKKPFIGRSTSSRESSRRI
jgi:hypothetical protein